MMAVGRNTHVKKWVSLSVLFGLTAISVPVSYAGPGDVNSINNGQDIQGGTYFNTPGSRTTFQNGNNNSLFLHKGDLVRGLESNINGVPTGNGGNLYFRGNVVRLDGNIDVSAVRNGTHYTGNGGTVTVDSNYLFQNGNIFANGANGGMVQFNVGAMTMGSTAHTAAQGLGGNGGTVSINSAGTVDLQSGSVIDTSGKVAGTFDTNVINIEGGAINNQAILRANGLVGTDLKGDNGDTAIMAANPQLANNPTPPPLSAGNGTHDLSMPNVLFGTPGSADFRGGTVRLVSSGHSQSVVNEINGSLVLSAAEKSAINNRNAQVVQFNEGDVFQRGSIEANGALSKNGGTVIISAARNVINSTTIQANGANSVDGVFDSNGNGGNGGNGGTIAFTAMNAINNSGTLQANGGNGAIAATVNTVTNNNANAIATVNGVGGTGGNGGLIAFNSSSASHTGSIQANGGVGGGGGHANTYDTESSSGGTPTANATSNGGVGGHGGHGGLLVFSGNSNPTGGGNISLNGGQGGRGGNAWADSQASSTTGTPIAHSTANAGAGGSGGGAGTLVTVNPAGFSLPVSARSGGSGNSGSASFREVTIRNGVRNTITGSSPVISGSVTSGGNSAILATRRNEYLSNAENGLLFTQAGGAGSNQTTLSGRLNDSLIRTVLNPAGSSGSNGAALANAEGVGNFVIGSQTSGLGLNNDLSNSNVNPLFFNLNTLSILNNGNLDNNMLWTPGVHLVGEGFHDLAFSLGGGHISWLANGNITNNQIVISRGLRSGGSIHMAAAQDVINNNDMIVIGPNKALLSGFDETGNPYDFSHAGSIILKGGRDVVNSSTGKIESNEIFFDIHPPLNQNPPIAWPRFLNGAQIGAKISLLAGRNLVNNGRIQADALTYRKGVAGAQNPALTTGGIVIGRHGGSFTNTGIITANGNAFFSPNENDDPRFTTNTFPATTSFNGIVDIP